MTDMLILYDKILKQPRAKYINEQCKYMLETKIQHQNKYINKIKDQMEFVELQNTNTKTKYSIMSSTNSMNKIGEEAINWKRES